MQVRDSAKASAAVGEQMKVILRSQKADTMCTFEKLLPALL